jgi:hypothetical protein
MKWKSFLLIGSCTFLITGCASTANKGLEQYIGRAIFEIPNSHSSGEVVDGIYNAIAWRSSNLQKFEKFMPEELPDTPPKPKLVTKQAGIGAFSFTFMNVDCGNDVWVSMNGQEDALKTSLGTSEQGGYRVCIYPYKDGYKAYIYGIYTYSESNSIGGLIVSGIRKVVNSSTCDGEKTYNCWFKQIVSKIEEKFPDAKVVRVDMPQH